METALRRYRVPLAAVAEIPRLGQVGVLPLIKQVPGLATDYWLNGKHGILGSISVFQDPAITEGSTCRVADSVRQQVVALVRNPRGHQGALVVQHAG
jgi:hypothetical protein